jgi:hypothetical protein
MNRREMLQSAMVGTLLLAPRWSPARAGERHRLTVIYDERYPGARALADGLRLDGITTLATRGDATLLWYGDPGTALTRGGEAVAGLTTWSDFVIARSRAREIGLRLAFEGRLDRAGQIAQEPIGPAGIFAEALIRVADAIEPSGRSGHLVAWLLMPRTSCPGAIS